MMIGRNITLAVAILCAGCGREVGPHVALPLATHAPAVIDRDPRALQLVCTPDGKLWVGKRIVPIEDLPAQLQNLQRGAVRIPVAIRADRQATFSNLWAMLKVCCAQYDDLLSLTVLTREPDSESEIAFTVLPPGDVAQYVTLTRTGDGFRVNGKAVQPDTLDRLLIRLAAFDRRTSILIIPAADDSVQDVAAVMDLCCKVGLSSIHVLKDGPVVEEIKEDAQQQGGGYSPSAARPSKPTP